MISSSSLKRIPNTMSEQLVEDDIYNMVTETEAMENIKNYEESTVENIIIVIEDEGQEEVSSPTNSAAEEIEQELESETREDIIISDQTLDGNISRRRSVHKCPLCDYETFRKHDLPKHISRHNGGQVPILKCSICDFRTISKKTLTQHLEHHKRSNEEPKDLECENETIDSTNQDISSAEELTEEKVELTESTLQNVVTEMYQDNLLKLVLHKCTQCNYETVDKSNLRKHIILHKYGKSMKCSVCEYRTTFKTRFNKHLALHGQFPDFTGESAEADCDYQNTDHTNLNGSLINDMTEEEIKQKLESKRRIIVTEKDEIFRQNALLRNILYKCTQCDYKTGHKTNFKKHLFLHVRGKPMMKCSLCEYQTISKIRFNKHLAFHEQNPDSTENPANDDCDNRNTDCTMSNSSSSNNLDKGKMEQATNVKLREIITEKDNIFYQNSIHKKVLYKCSQCDYETVNKANFGQHVLIHVQGKAMMKCSLCEYQTISKKRFNKHVTHHEKTSDSIEKLTDANCNTQNVDCTKLTVSSANNLNENKRKQYLKSGRQRIITDNDKDVFTTAFQRNVLYKCGQCGYETLRKHDFQQHVYRHKRGMRRCSICQYKTSSEKKFNKHLVIHNITNLVKDAAETEDTNEATSIHNSVKDMEIFEEDEGDSIEEPRIEIKNMDEDYSSKGYKRNDECSLSSNTAEDRKKELDEYTEVINSSGDLKFKCPYCNLKTKYRNNFKKHLFRCQKKKPRKRQIYKCSQCDYETKLKSILIKHYFLHEEREGQVFKCSKCGYKTISRFVLKNHKHIEPDNIQTNKSPKSSYEIIVKTQPKLPNEYQDHETVLRPNNVETRRSSECSHTTKENIEDSSYGQKTNNIEPQKTPACLDIEPNKIRKYKCSECDYQTANRMFFLKHWRIHQRNKSVLLKCDLCNFKTLSTHLLKRHQELQNHPATVKVHKCAQCGYQTSCKSSFNKHMNVHNKRKNFNKFKCTECKYKTSLEEYFLLHCIRHKKRNASTYQCHTCDFKTICRKYLREHQVLENHPPPPKKVLKCEICDYQTTVPTNLKDHRMIHMNREDLVMFKCSECSYQTFRKRDLAIHRRKHLSNEEVQKYLCHMCDYITIHKSNLTRHLYKQHGYDERRKTSTRKGNKIKPNV